MPSRSSVDASLSVRTITFRSCDSRSFLAFPTEATSRENELRETSEWACEKEWVDATQIFFQYFASHYLFFSTMLASKGAPSFRSKFLQFLIEGFKDEVDITKGKNHGLNENVIVKFAANAYVGVLESWLKDGMPTPPLVMAKELGILLERIV
jgi:hypothetical protein